MANISSFKIFACVRISCCAPCCSFLVFAQERACYVHRAGLVKAAHPKLLRVSGGGERELPPGEDHWRDHKKSQWSRGPVNYESERYS